MSKPEDVTDEAWDAARKWLREPVADTHGNHLLYFLSYDFERYGMAVLARAIMASEKRGEERERVACAAIAQDYTGSGMVVGGSTGSAHQTKKDIAAAINARSA